MWNALFGGKSSSKDAAPSKSDPHSETKSSSKGGSTSSSLGWQATKTLGKAGWWAAKTGTKVAAKGALVTAKGTVWATKKVAHAATAPSKEKKINENQDASYSSASFHYPDYTVYSPPPLVESKKQDRLDQKLKDFFDAFEAFKSKPIDSVTDEEINALFELAESVQTAEGYLDAFYDIAEYLHSQKYSPRQAYKRVDPQSSHYQEACINAAEFEYFQALYSEIGITKTDHIKASLKFSLNISNNLTQRAYIQKNAELYVKEKIVQGEEPVNIEAILNGITPQTKAKDLLAQFDQFKKDLPGSALIKRLEDENLRLRATYQLQTLNQEEKLDEVELVEPAAKRRRIDKS